MVGREPAGKPIMSPKRKPFVSVADALEDAQHRANSVRIPTPVLNHLYAHSCETSVARDEWERQVRVATAFDENLTRLGSPRLLKQIMEQIGTPLPAAFGFEPGGTSTLVIIYHGGYCAPLRRLFQRTCPNAVIIGAIGKYSAQNGALALFAARKALLDSRPVMIGPDGRFGKEALTISVLRAEAPMTDGAPYLAHSTRCNVAWGSLLWTAQGFTIEVAAGPRCEVGEPFTAYRGRFYQFYADRLEQAFTRDPLNLPLTKNWIFIFSAMLAGEVHRFRRLTR
jgi:hypothetical protein